MSDTMNKPKVNFRKVLGHAIRSSLFLYVLIGALLWRVVDLEKANINRLNRIKSQIAGDLQSFATGTGPFDQYAFEWGIRYFKKLLVMLPNNPLAYGNLGFCYYYLNDPSRAIEAYKKAVTLDPRFYTYYWDMGMISLQSQNLKQAEIFFIQSLHLIPSTVAHLGQISNVLTSRGKGDLADVPLRTIRRAFIDEEIAYRELSKIYFVMKNFELMRDVALRGLEQHPDSAQLNLLVGIAIVKLENYGDALDYLNKAIELNPRSIDAYYYRSLCMDQLGDKDQGDKDRLKFADLKNERQQADENLGTGFRLHLNDELMMILPMLRQ